MIIGIDLGTTFSVIAVNGRVKLVPGYPEARYLERCDVSIIPDEYGNYTIASAVAEDPESPGKLTVGCLARETNNDGASPILFSKRNIGSNILHPLGQRAFTARQTATEILIYLKGITEQALGHRVNRAVITHPAYFEAPMKEETALAARDAGFDFETDGYKHLLMEPIAAALAYARVDKRDPLNMLTYDLGGGTFDVTVMERRKGVTTVKAFGGNRLLGGFNFDRELAFWLLRRLQERGVLIALDESNPEDRNKLVRLLRLAEDTKIKLANARTDKMPVQIRQQAIFDDNEGRPINLLDQITREEFVALIQELLDETITGPGGEGETKGCNVTLAEAGLTIEKIDEVLLVGGSCYAPWVSETIEKAWHREAQLFEPDLCVAAGAAIYATTLPEEIRSASCRVKLDVPKESNLDVLSVAGHVEPVVQDSLPQELKALLKSQLGKTIGPRALNPDGGFVFEAVELQPESITKFALSIIDNEGRTVLEHDFEITHAPDKVIIPFFNVLPKPLFIEVLDGLQPLAEEGQTLPAHVEIDLFRTNVEETIELRLFQENEPVGSMIIEKVPKEAPIDAKVKLVVDVSGDNRIIGRVTVFTRKGAVAAEAPVDIRIPPMQIPDMETLKAEFEELESERSERVELERNAETRMMLEARGSRIRQKITGLFGKPGSHQEIWLALRQLRRLIYPPKNEMEPASDYFERVLLRIQEILATQTSDPIVQGHARMVERLESEARVAYSKKDRRTWGQIITRLENLLRRLERPEKEDDRPVSPTFLQKLVAIGELDQTRRLLRAKEVELTRKDQLERLQDSVNDIRADIEAVNDAIEQIDDNLDPRRAQGQVQLLRYQKIKPLEIRIETLGYDVRKRGVF